MDKKILDALQKLEKRMSTMEQTMVTKTDFKIRHDQLNKKIDKLDDVQWAIFRTVDEIKADKSKIVKLNERISQIERKFTD